MAEFVELDGASGEGGGQILRTSLTLSVLTGRPFCIRNIRARRSPPGLRPQHLVAVRAAERISAAYVDGAAVDSMELRFSPTQLQPGDYEFPIPTAGSAPLVLHTVYLPLLLQAEPSKATISGGTHVAFSPCYDYLVDCWLPALARLGAKMELQLLRCGFYPRGGGLMTAAIENSALSPIQWTSRGKLLRITPVSVVANLPVSIAERQAHRADKRLREKGLKKSLRNPIIEQRPAASPGTLLGLRCEWEYASGYFFALGQRGKPAEKVADEAVAGFIAFHNVEDCPVDPHLADQLLLPLAMTNGASEFRTSEVTQHLVTNAEVIKKFLDRSIVIDGDVGAPATVRVQ